MSDMKCPFCQQAIMCMDAQGADEHSTWYCPRCIAERAWYAFGNETLWQELIRTRKALDVAVDALKNIFDYSKIVSSELQKNHLSQFQTPINKMQYSAQQALKQITALEQKDK